MAFAILTTACSGPRTPLEVAVREFPSDVILGSSNEAAEPIPLPPAALTARDSERPAPLAAPLPPVRRELSSPATTTRSSARPRPRPAACPAADPFAVPELAAELSARRPPVPAEYAYRNVGEVSVSGAEAHKDAYRVDSRRRVEGVEENNAGFTFDVVASLREAVTTTSYQVVTESPVPADPGLYITGVRVVEEDGSEQDFRPTPSLKLLAFPAEQGATWVAAGTDQASGVTMRYEAVVDGRVRVDACGSVLDAMSVTLKGDVFGPTGGAPVAQFTATYAIATQYGGLSVHDVVDISRTGADGSVSRRNTATIRAVPQEPAP